MVQKQEDPQYKDCHQSPLLQGVWSSLVRKKLLKIIIIIINITIVIVLTVIIIVNVIIIVHMQVHQSQERRVILII